MERVGYQHSMTAQTEVSITTKNTASLTLGIIACVLGTVALLVSWVPFLGVFGLPLAGIGLLLSLIGIVAAVVKGKGFTMPILGGFLCGLSVAIFITMTAGATKAITDAAERSKAERAATNAPATP